MELWILILLSCILGVLCESPQPTVTPCNSNPCKNGGNCHRSTWRTRGYYCTCQKGFVGDTCETETPCATGNPCQNGGRCQGSTWTRYKYRCSCNGGWMGTNCTEDTPCVHDNPCKNGGNCRPVSYNDAKYRCSCRGDNYGQNCTKESPCKTGNPCQNSGRCYTSTYNDKGYTCYCPGHYFGDNCEKESPCLKANPCQNGGACRTNRYRNEGYNCMCTQGYGGKHCNLVDPCTSDNMVCKNGGTCYSHVTGSTDERYEHRCQCPKTHIGKYCEKESPCMSNPCKNNGTCYAYESENSLYCSCIDDFRGQWCERKRCPVRMNCQRNITRMDELSPTECVANEESAATALQNCYERKSKAMMDSESCDCTVDDYFQTKLYDRYRGPYGNKYIRCASRALKTSTCANYTKQCAIYVREAARFMRLDRACSDEQKSLKSELQKCHADYEAGKINFEGCEILEDAYKSIKHTVEMYLKLACTDCDLMQIGGYCMPYSHRRRPLCNQQAEYPKLKACFKEQLEANASCADATDSVMKVLDDHNVRQGCGDIQKYSQKLEKLGCVTESDVDSSTITKRDTESSIWEMFNNYNIFQ